MEEANPSTTPCLALHIWHTDKGNGHHKIALSCFLPYAKAFVTAGGQAIYVATDSSVVIGEIKASWPQEVSNKAIMQNNASQSNSSRAVFDMTEMH